MEDRRSHAALARVPVQLAQLRLWRDARFGSRVHPGVVGRDAAWNSHVCLHRIAGRRPRQGFQPAWNERRARPLGAEHRGLRRDGRDRGLRRAYRCEGPSGEDGVKEAAVASPVESPAASDEAARLAIAPTDVHDRALAANVHPEDWLNPEPAGRYNLVVVGAGTAGLVAAGGAAGLGARVALVERDLMGGDC